MIAERERATYDDLWRGVEAYGQHAPGEGYVSLFVEMSGAAPGQAVLDAGCGSGKGALALFEAGFDVALFDLTDAGLTFGARQFDFVSGCLWKDALPSPDWIYCCDVLEHVPTEYTMLVIARLLEAAARGIFLSIALVPDQFGVWVGKPLHQTVRDYKWWFDRLADLGTVVEARDLIDTGLYLVRPR